MSSKATIGANRRNAQRSTGPRTKAGKAASSRNATRHAVFAASPVIPGVERAEDWEAHRAATLESLAPVGHLETALAERVAQTLWRLNRVVRFEATAIATGQEEAAERARGEDANSGDRDAGRLRKVDRDLEGQQGEQEGIASLLRLLNDLPGLGANAAVPGDVVRSLLEEVVSHLPAGTPAVDFEGDAFLKLFGLPADEDPWEEATWTATQVRDAVGRLASLCGTTVERLLGLSAASVREVASRGQKAIDQLAGEAEGLRGRLVVREQRERGRCELPDDVVVQKVCRYEAHLNRTLFQALHELERLQARRAGRPHLPPMAVDVHVDAPVG